jgi:hypothetical protein
LGGGVVYRVSRASESVLSRRAKEREGKSEKLIESNMSSSSHTVI